MIKILKMLCDFVQQYNFFYFIAAARGFGYALSKKAAKNWLLKIILNTRNTIYLLVKFN